MEEKTSVLAAIADLALRMTRGSTILHAFFSIGFGSSLIVSGVLGRDGTDHPAYTFIVAVPFWPYSVGAVFILAGLLIFGSTVSRRYQMRHFCIQGIGFSIESLAAATYAFLFAAGAYVSDNALIGPQWLYGFVAASAALRAYYALEAIHVVQRTGA
jgi:hypothetical protein